ncbi:hypothetical protein J6590_084591 [Homalodisca vitripennis]|nr:hypothetical protein J6590_084591 [Homalodisca vitripennis]
MRRGRPYIHSLHQQRGKSRLYPQPLSAMRRGRSTIHSLHQQREEVQSISTASINNEISSHYAQMTTIVPLEDAFRALTCGVMLMFLAAIYNTCVCIRVLCSRRSISVLHTSRIPRTWQHDYLIDQPLSLLP